MWWRRLATSLALVIALMAAWSYGVGEKFSDGPMTIILFALVIQVSEVITIAEAPPWSERERKRDRNG